MFLFNSYESYLIIIYSLTDDLGEAKSTISELTRRYHELEIELRRLENERDELTAAYKEAEAVIIHFFLNYFFFDLFFFFQIN